MRAVTSRSVPVVTALTWLLLLLVLFAAGQRITFGGLIALINDAIVFAMFGVVVASVCFAYRPRRWLAVVLLIISLIPACFFVYALWEHMSFFRTFGGHYFDALWFSRNDQLYLCGAVIFVTLALLWAAICWCLRDVGTTT
jgi:hypothetical protein